MCDISSRTWWRPRRGLSSGHDAQPLGLPETSPNLSRKWRGARQLAEGSPESAWRSSSTDEVGLLAHTLNQMTDQLETKIKEVSDDRAQLLAMLIAMVEGVMVLDYRGPSSR